MMEKMMKVKFLWNPYEKIAGAPALLVGLLFMCLSSYLASLNGTHFDGVLDVHLGASTGWYVPFVENIFNWLLLSLLSIVSCLVVSKSHFRIIDVLGTIALSRAPLALAASIGFLDIINRNDPYDINNILVGFLILFIVVWAMILLFNSLKISANLKKEKLWIVFIIVVVLAEIISKLLINKVYLLIL